MRKTKKSVSRRFRMNSKGKIKRGRPGRGHLLTGKARARKRKLGQKAMLKPMDEHRLREFLPHG